jgi:hypothetical protein
VQAIDLRRIGVTWLGGRRGVWLIILGRTAQFAEHLLDGTIAFLDLRL